MKIQKLVFQVVRTRQKRKEAARSFAQILPNCSFCVLELRAAVTRRRSSVEINPPTKERTQVQPTPTHPSEKPQVRSDSKLQAAAADL